MLSDKKGEVEYYFPQWSEILNELRDKNKRDTERVKGIRTIMDSMNMLRSFASSLIFLWEFTDWKEAYW